MVTGVAEQDSKERDQEKRKESMNNENLTGTIEKRENRAGKKIVVGLEEELSYTQRNYKLSFPSVGLAGKKTGLN